MSHVLNSKAKHRNIIAIQRAVKKFLKAKFNLNQKRYYSYTGNNNPCTHAIHLEGCSYEIGVVNVAKPGQPPEWQLQHDNYGPGQMLDKLFGPGLKLLNQEISKQTVILEYERSYKPLGWGITEVKLPNGTIKLQLTKY